MTSILDGISPLGAGRVISGVPVDLRFAEYPDGRKVLQGAYPWSEGMLAHGVEWRDIQCVKVDESGQEIDDGPA